MHVGGGCRSGGACGDGGGGAARGVFSLLRDNFMGGRDAFELDWYAPRPFSSRGESAIDGGGGAGATYTFRLTTDDVLRLVGGAELPSAGDRAAWDALARRIVRQCEWRAVPAPGDPRQLLEPLLTASRPAPAPPPPPPPPLVVDTAAGGGSGGDDRSGGGDGGGVAAAAAEAGGDGGGIETGAGGDTGLGGGGSADDCGVDDGSGAEVDGGGGAVGAAVEVTSDAAGDAAAVMDVPDDSACVTLASPALESAAAGPSNDATGDTPRASGALSTAGAAATAPIFLDAPAAAAEATPLEAPAAPTAGDTPTATADPPDPAGAAADAASNAAAVHATTADATTAPEPLPPPPPPPPSPPAALQQLSLDTCIYLREGLELPCVGDDWEQEHMAVDVAVCQLASRLVVRARDPVTGFVGELPRRSGDARAADAALVRGMRGMGEEERTIQVEAMLEGLTILQTPAAPDDPEPFPEQSSAPVQERAAEPAASSTGTAEVAGSDDAAGASAVGGSGGSGGGGGGSVGGGGGESVSLASDAVTVDDGGASDDGPMAPGDLWYLTLAGVAEERISLGVADYNALVNAKLRAATAAVEDRTHRVLEMQRVRAAAASKGGSASKRTRPSGSEEALAAD